jgi:hypothetical protein
LGKAFVPIICGIAIGFVLFAPSSHDAKLRVAEVSPFVALAAIGFSLGSYFGSEKDRFEFLVMGALTSIMLLGDVAYGSFVTPAWKDGPFYQLIIVLRPWAVYGSCFLLFVASGGAFNPMRRVAPKN